MKQGFQRFAPRTVRALLCLAVAATGVDARADIVFSTYTPYASPTNFPSQAYQATSTSEFGDAIGLGAGSRNLTSVTVTMSDWALASTYGSQAAGYNQQLTLNLYNYTGTTVGAAFASSTVTAFVPWRPEPTSNCSDDPSNPKGYGANCYHGIAFDVTFDFSGVTLPDNLVYGLAFNTQSYGTRPTGVDGPYDSLNFAFASVATPSAGVDLDPDALFLNGANSYPYTTESPGGTYTGTPGSFNEDSGWAGLVPMVQFVTSDATTVPEPSSIALFGIAGAGLLLARRRAAR